ncbi:circularly permuted type 2 ATP-grasp protein [Telmatospirillum sp.]|uniref:circularly permuted type 2 ATP-grasp protein n=1 Tax=Telmatospirillum sp. TaxID=2079197 RepID=UPI00283FC4B4|nr:circularly permuted type 2 ATP-grasp protein [Telmatospirillum sp.]MDR3440078.1 circularly permuted type 2 ATP-grasp protein [Telmatospirillum sp.]
MTGQESFPGAFSLGYPVVRGHWDEMVEGDGLLRSHWTTFIKGLSDLPTSEMASRWDRGQRLIRENGVTYNVYRDPRGLDRPWQLDPVPMILPAQEWRVIEQGLIQRVTLLNQILADLYGDRSLLGDGLLPPALVFGHPGFLRPLHNVPQAGGVHLHFYAADLARSPDGQWWVMSDRCEAPSGAGYALENRTIIARSLPDIMRRQPVEPLTPFFQKLRETLFSLSPRHRETPRIVLLTPGPYNESFFEHAYLARFLGYTLVEAEDLTVRDDHVYLKTLDGLQPVDVILRRTDGAYCDPLELRNDSTLGVAGLVQAVRRGTVVVANSLGSGLLESGAMAPFLPVLARRLLNEELKLPSVATWWCGAEKERGYVLANLDRLVIKRAYLGGRTVGEPVFGDQLTTSRQAELAATIGRTPHAFLAQERLRLSTAPVWTAGQLDPRPLMVRVFVAAHDGGYVAMPGGLTRIAAERDGKIVSMQYGGGSKDTWILAEEQNRRAIPIRSSEPPVKLVRGAHDLPSRVADNLYWFGRYVERTEDTTRLLRAALSRVGNAAGFGAAAELPAALRLLNSLCRKPGGKDPEEAVLTIARMSFDPAQMHGLRSTVERVHRMAAMARDRLSLDTWRAVNRLHDELAQVDVSRGTEDLVTMLNGVVLACEALNGLAMENMTRGLAWRFIDIGRRLERGMHVIDILSNSLQPAEDGGSAALDVLLEVSDSAMTYRSRYLSAPQFSPVLDLLLADESNPRSLAYQYAALDHHMEQLAAGRRAAFYGPEQRLTIWLCGAVRTAQIEILARPDDDGERRNLAAFLEVLRAKLWELSETLTREYFTHAVSRSPNGTVPMREPMP